MKLWFEGWNVNAFDASQLQPMSTPAAAAAAVAPCAIKHLAEEGRRGDSAANHFFVKT
jgi:hypothetical protein